jgi:hypothetical protein
VSTLNTNADWTEQNNSTAVLKVLTNAYHSSGAAFADCCTKTTGYTTSQYASVQLGGTLTQNDEIGVNLFNNNGAFGSHSMYRCTFWCNSGGATECNIYRVINGSATDIFDLVQNMSAGDFLSCEVQIVSGNPVFQFYRDTGSGPVAVGTTFTDSNAAKLVTGKPGISAFASGNLALADNWEAGNLTASGGTLLRPRAMTGGMHDMSRGM